MSDLDLIEKNAREKSLAESRERGISEEGAQELADEAAASARFASSVYRKSINSGLMQDPNAPKKPPAEGIKGLYPKSVADGHMDPDEGGDTTP